jgi:hypothetical protein
MDDLKTMADGSAVTLGIGTFMNYINLPLIIQLLTAAYLLVRIWESKTIQGWFGRNKSDDQDYIVGDVPNVPEEAVVVQTKKKPRTSTRKRKKV